MENGTNSLLNCEVGKEDEAKIKLMNAVLEWYDPLSSQDINRINKDVYIQRGLRKRIEKLSNKTSTQLEAGALLGFLDNAYNSSWSQEDEHYQIKDFRIVKTNKEFEKIFVKFKEAEELTSKKELLIDFKTIRVAIVPMDFKTIYKKKGIFEEYETFYKKNIVNTNFGDAFDMFNLWHDVRETAIYYIYLGDK